MKNYKKTSKQWLLIMCTAGFLSMLLSSCLKNDNTTPAPPFAYVSVIQASPDAPGTDFYLDNNKVNVQPLNYGSYIDYFQAKVGSRSAYFYTTGTVNKLASTAVTFQDQGVYSIFLTNKISTPDLVVVQDSISTPAVGNAAIRLVNVSPDAPAVDLVATGGTVLIPNIAYKGHSSFIPVPGNTVNSYEIRQHGTNTVLATLTGANISSGSVYTVWLHGLTTNPGNTPLIADIITNAHYN